MEGFPASPLAHLAPSAYRAPERTFQFHSSPHTAQISQGLDGQRYQESFIPSAPVYRSDVHQATIENRPKFQPLTARVSPEYHVNINHDLTAPRPVSTYGRPTTSTTHTSNYVVTNDYPTVDTSRRSPLYQPLQTSVEPLRPSISKEIGETIVSADPPVLTASQSYVETHTRVEKKERGCCGCSSKSKAKPVVQQHTVPPTKQTRRKGCCGKSNKTTYDTRVSTHGVPSQEQVPTQYEGENEHLKNSVEYHQGNPETVRIIEAQNSKKRSCRCC